MIGGHSVSVYLSFLEITFVFTCVCLISWLSSSLVGWSWSTGDADMLLKALNSSPCPRAPEQYLSDTLALAAKPEQRRRCLRSHFHVSVVLILSPRPIPLIHYWTLHIAHWPLEIALRVVLNMAMFGTILIAFNTISNNTVNINQDVAHSNNKITLNNEIRTV